MNPDSRQDSIDRVYVQRQPSRLPWVVALLAIAAVAAAVIVVPRQWRRLTRGFEQGKVQDRVDEILTAAESSGDPQLAAMLVAELRGLPEPVRGIGKVQHYATRVRPLSIHTGQGTVTCLAFSPDSRSFATGAADGTVRVAATDGREEPAVLRGHAAAVTSVAFNEGAQFVVSGAADGTARLYRADGRGASIVLRSGHRVAVTSVAFSPESRRVLTGSADGTVRIFSVDGTGETLVLGDPTGQGRPAHGGAVISVAWSPDGHRAVSGSVDGTAQVYWANGGGDAIVLGDHDGEVWRVAFTEDGDRVLTAAADGTIRWWRAGAQPRVFDEHKGAVTSAVFSANGQGILTSSNDHSAILRLADGSGEPRRFEADEMPMTGAVFSPEGSRFLTASEDGIVRLWDTGGTLRLELVGHGDWVRAMAFSPDGSRIVTGSDDRTAMIWEAWSRSKPVVLTEHGGGLVAAGFHPDGRRVFTASIDVVRIWPLDGSEIERTIRGSRGRLITAAWSPDGRYLLLAQQDKVAEVRTADGARVLGQVEHRDRLVDAAWSPDGSRVATASVDGEARVWPAQRQGPAVVLAGHTQEVTDIAWSADGSRVVTASADGTARVWRADGSAPPVVLRGHFGRVLSAAFSPDGRQVLTAGLDGSARLWPLRGSADVVREHRDPSWAGALGLAADGTRLLTSADGGLVVGPVGAGSSPFELPVDPAELAGAALSGDGLRVVTASTDGTVRVWRADGSGEPLVLRGHLGPVHDAAWHPDGDRVVTTSDDLTLRLWQVLGPDAVKGARPRTLGGEPRPARCADLVPGRLAAFAYQGRSVELWDLAEGRRVAVLEGHDDEVTSLAFSPAGDRLVTTSKDGTARIWTVGGDSASAARVLAGHQDVVLSAVWNAAGSAVLTTSRDGTARVWRVSGGEPEILDAAAGEVAAGVFLEPDHAVTGHADGKVRRWSFDVGYRLHGEPEVLPGGHDEGVRSVAVLPSGHLLSTAADGTAQVWTAGGELLATLYHDGIRGAVADDRRIVTISADSTVRLWPVSELGAEGLRWPLGHVLEPRILRGHQAGVWGATLVVQPAAEPPITRLVTIGDDGAALSWLLDEDRSRPLILNRWPTPLRCIEVDPLDDDTVLVAADGRYQINHAGEMIGRGTGERRQAFVPRCTVFSDDGDTIFTTAADGTVLARRADGRGASRRQPEDPAGASGCPGTEATSPDGARIAEAGDYGVAVRPASGRGRPVLLETGGVEVRSVAWSPDGERLLAALWDGTARIWRADGEGEPMVLRGHHGPLESAAWSPNGQRVVTASTDGTARVWRVGWSNLLAFLDESLRTCLSVEQRMEHLGEERSRAIDAYRACERRKGRVPAV